MNTPHMRALLIVSSVMCVAGCQHDPHAHRYATEKPPLRELVGTYVLKSETLLQSDLAELSGRACIVELHVDGTFRAENVPLRELKSAGPGFFGKLRSGSGKWRVDPVGTVDNGWQVKTVWGVYLDSPARFTPAHIAGQRPPYSLIFSLGDPDSGEVLVLERAM
jgi:hypothetical protein